MLLSFELCPSLFELCLSLFELCLSLFKLCLSCEICLSVESLHLNMSVVFKLCQNAQSAMDVNTYDESSDEEKWRVDVEDDGTDFFCAVCFYMPITMTNTALGQCQGNQL